MVNLRSIFVCLTALTAGFASAAAPSSAKTCNAGGLVCTRLFFNNYYKSNSIQLLSTFFLPFILMEFSCLLLQMTRTP